jgi:zinc protease
VYGARAHMREGLDLLLDISRQPKLSTSQVELVRGRLQSEARHRLSDPSSLMGRRALEQFYRDLPYAADPDGTLESLEGLTAAELRAHHERVYDRSRLLVVAVGRLDREALVEQLTQGLGSVAAGQAPSLELPPSAGAVEPRFDVIEREQPTNHVLALFAGPSLGSDDYPAFYAALDYLSHRLFEEVRTKRNLAYAVSASAANLAVNHGRILAISVDPKRCFEVIAEELERLRRTPIEPKALSDTLLQLRTGLWMQRTRLAAQADELGRAHLVGGHYTLAERFAERVVQVTPAEVQAVYQRYLRNFNVVLVGNPEAVPRDFFLSLGA